MISGLHMFGSVDVTVKVKNYQWLYYSCRDIRRNYRLFLNKHNCHNELVQLY